MGDLKIGETFQDAVYITTTATGLPATGLAPTCTFVKIADNTRTAGTVQEVGSGWYRVTDFTNDAAGTWTTEWAVAGAYTIYHASKLFKVGGGTVTDLETKVDTIDTNVDAVLVDTGTTIPGTITVIDGFHDVPAQDAAANSQLRDVIGNKTDTVAGDSLVALAKLIKAKTDNLPTDPADDSDLDGQLATIDSEVGIIDEYHDVPAADSVLNAQINEVIGNKTDTVAGNSIIALLKQLIVDTGTDIVADFDRHLTCVDFWSDAVNVVTITGGATDVNLPDVIIPTLPTGATLWKIVVLFKCALIRDTSASDNAINGACNLRIKKSTGAWDTDDITAYNIQDNSWAVDVSTSADRGGDAFVGNINNDNLTGEVDAAGTYNLRFDAIQADGANLELHDVAVGLRVYFY